MPAILDSQRRLKKFSSDHDNLHVSPFKSLIFEETPSRQLPKTFEGNVIQWIAVI